MRPHSLILAAAQSCHTTHRDQAYTKKPSTDQHVNKTHFLQTTRTRFKKVVNLDVTSDE